MGDRDTGTEQVDAVPPTGLDRAGNQRGSDAQDDGQAAPTGASAPAPNQAAGAARASGGPRRVRWRLAPSWRMPVAVFLWAQIILLLWWIGEYPGLMSADSVRYVIHVTSGPWTADHSVLYDSMVLGSLDLTRNIALVVALQTTAGAASLAYAAASLRVVGVAQWVAAIPAFVLPLLPPFGDFVTTLWKDVPFALCEVLLFGIVLRLVALDVDAPDARRKRRRLVIGMALAFLGMVLFRHDGFVVIMGVVALLLIALRGLRLRVLAVGVGAIVAMFFAQVVVYPAIGVQPSGKSLTYGIFYGDIAVAYGEAPRTFTASDKALLSRIAPLDEWRAADNCYSSDVIFRSRHFDATASDANSGQMMQLWFRIAERTPVTLARARLCRGSVAWALTPPPSDKARLGESVMLTLPSLYGHAHLIPSDIAKNLPTRPLNSALGTLTHRLRVHSNELWVQPFLWRAALWCYLGYLAVTIAAVRLRWWRLLAVASVALSQQVVVTLLNPAQLYRYVAGALFVGMLMIPIVAARRARTTATEVAPQRESRMRSTSG